MSPSTWRTTGSPGSGMSGAVRLKPGRVDCKLCGGHQTLALDRGTRVEWVAFCHRCRADYAELARAHDLPLEERPRPRQPAPRFVSEYDRALGPLLQREEAWRARRRPWLRVWALSDEVRREMNRARSLRELVTDLGDCDMAWACAAEAAARERRAHGLLLDIANTRPARSAR